MGIPGYFRYCKVFLVLLMCFNYTFVFLQTSCRFDDVGDMNSRLNVIEGDCHCHLGLTHTSFLKARLRALRNLVSSSPDTVLSSLRFINIYVWPSVCQCKIQNIHIISNSMPLAGLFPTSFIVYCCFIVI